MMNATDLPPLTPYQLSPLPALLPPIPDKILLIIGPIAAYWIWSLLFHCFDIFDLFPQYRLHTPVEVARRNRASRWEVLRDVLTQQALQAVIAYFLGLTEPDDFCGQEDHDIAIWARRLRRAQRAIPAIFSLFGLDSLKIGNAIADQSPQLGGIFLGGFYQVSPSWELMTAKAIYYFAVPILQYTVAIVWMDTWQYFLHRAMHMNKYLYTTLHARHHRLYVPYAYGALYNHPVEGFILDTIGASIAYKLAGLSTRQGIYYFTFATLKTVDDHCGYALPWDPLQHFSGNNAGYHDVHHQTWGIKTNFSQPFFTFWDRVLGTAWTGGDVSARYERSRLAAEKAEVLSTANLDPVTKCLPADSLSSPLDPYTDDVANATEVPSSLQPQAPPGKAVHQAAGSRQSVMDDKATGGISVLAEEVREEQEARASLRRSPRKRRVSLRAQEGLAGLSQRVSNCMTTRA